MVELVSHKKTAASMIFSLEKRFCNFLHDDIICVAYVCGCSVCFQLPISSYNSTKSTNFLFQGIQTIKQKI